MPAGPYPPPPPPRRCDQTRRGRPHPLQAELYFLQDPTDLRQPIGRACLRNEAAAVSLLLSYLDEGEQAEPARPGSSEQQHLANGGGGTAAPPAAAPAAGGSSPNAAAAAESKAALRGQLLRYCEQLWPEFASGDLTLASHQQLPLAVAPPPDSAPAAFERWAGEQGVGAAVGMASFGALRGCAALRDIAPGDKVLSLPIEALIYDDTVAQTDLVSWAWTVCCCLRTSLSCGLGRRQGRGCRLGACPGPQQAPGSAMRRGACWARFQGGCPLTTCCSSGR